MNELIKRMAAKHFAAVEELTLEQFEDALLGAIKSGDFMRHVEPSRGLQGLSYIPYREKMELKQEIERLKEIEWMYAEACSLVDQGKDIRKMEVPEILYRAEKELSQMNIPTLVWYHIKTDQIFTLIDLDRVFYCLYGDTSHGAWEDFILLGEL